MKNTSFLTIILLLYSSALFSQIAVNTDGSQPNSAAMLDVSSAVKGALIPRMTQAQISMIINPANGLMVFCTTENKFYVYVASANSWKEILYGSGTITSNCGSLTINHVAGVVAPVPKTVVYGTVSGIPGEPSKCWITSNLGASHQAMAVDDATEASAGWYWQFNRKQGYKHDGTARTPTTTWTSSIIENSEWIAANDPCSIELGGGWRIPTLAEWSDVNATNGWTNMNDTWNSPLKMHAAGFLDHNTGSRYNIGLYGNYWSSGQRDTGFGWYLVFDNLSSGIPYDYKATGFSLRCLRNN